MKKKRNRVPIVIVVLLGGLSCWLIFNNKKGTIKETLRDFAVEDTAAITKIFLADKENKTITLERQPTGIWMVNGKFIARRDAIKTLLYTIRKVDVKEPVGKKAQDNVIKNLSGAAVKCEIYQGSKLVKAYYVGTETQDQTGTYMILIDAATMKPSAKPFITYIPGFEGYLTTRYFTDEKSWRDLTVFKYHPDHIQSVRLEIPFKPGLGYEVLANGNNSYEVRTLKDKKTIADLDTISVKQYLAYFQNLNFEAFEDVLSQEQMDSVLHSQPLNILTVTDKDGSSRRVEFYARYPKKKGEQDVNGQEILYDQERMNARIDDSKELVVLQYYVFGKVLPPVDYFRKK